MKTFITNLRNIVVSGFFFLLPVVVVWVIVTKTWTALGSVGAGLAAMFGMKSIMGLAGTNVFTGILMIAICLLCGLMVLRRRTDQITTRLAITWAMKSYAEGDHGTVVQIASRMIPKIVCPKASGA